MFGFLRKRNNTIQVVSPVTGQLIHIEDVNDPVFSSKIMGEGFAVIPEEETVVAPVSGVIVTVAETGHAFGMKTKEGVEILVHIGIDTVNLGGAGFSVLEELGSKVQAGTPVIQYDKEFLNEKKMDPTVITIITAGCEKAIRLVNAGKTVRSGELVIAE